MLTDRRRSFLRRVTLFSPLFSLSFSLSLPSLSLYVPRRIYFARFHLPPNPEFISRATGKPIPTTLAGDTFGTGHGFTLIGTPVEKLNTILQAVSKPSAVSYPELPTPPLRFPKRAAGPRNFCGLSHRAERLITTTIAVHCSSARSGGKEGKRRGRGKENSAGFLTRGASRGRTNYSRKLS